ncbi:MAG: ribosome-associated translation inhibitor RaiA [Betaproteobacteria bacterium]|nr:ribosome-associated translation inhibitor RaiA [Betaproteobacteria bacterium]MBI2959652.1 ribosome-associated translation inhibitor RaiA [Betaproteobacteria bacterium]
MQTALQITVRDMDHSDALDQHIRDKVAKIERIYPRLMGCRVVAEHQDRHKQQGKHFAVRVDLTLPGKEIVVTRQHAEDPYVALRDAFDAAKRQVEEYASVQRRDSKLRRAGSKPGAEPPESE